MRTRDVRRLDYSKLHKSGFDDHECAIVSHRRRKRGRPPIVELNTKHNLKKKRKFVDLNSKLHKSGRTKKPQRVNRSAVQLNIAIEGWTSKEFEKGSCSGEMSDAHVEGTERRVVTFHTAPEQLQLTPSRRVPSSTKLCRHCGREFLYDGEIDSPTLCKRCEKQPEGRSISLDGTPLELPDIDHHPTSLRSASCGHVHPRIRTCMMHTDDPLPEPHDIGCMNYVCSKCGALHWALEKTSGTSKEPLYGSCCHNGKILLNNYTLNPEDDRRISLLHHLFSEENSKEGKEFRKGIRAYNSALALASMWANVDHSLANGQHGAYCFRIHGAVHHLFGDLETCRESPAFAQIYVHDMQDSSAELRNRMKSAGGSASLLNPDLMLRLQDMFHHCNPYVEFFRHAMEILEAARKRARDTVTDNSFCPLNVRMTICSDKCTATHVASSDLRNVQRTYSVPTCASEVAVLLPHNNDIDHSTAVNRQVVLYARRPEENLTMASINSTSPTASGYFIRGLKTISELHPAYDPLCYVLFFPRGEQGWCPEVQSTAPRILRGRIIVNPKVTCLQFYEYHLQVRGQKNPLHYGGRLLQQYVVDMYAKVELQRLNYLRFNQKQLRAETYQGMMDTLHHNDSIPAAEIGRRIILPSTFNGGPRYMHGLYQDAMAIVRKHGKPSLFITFTCNPKWKEIQRELLPGQTSSDRPDLVDRVFAIKLKELLHVDIEKRNLFGSVKACIYTVEFQKRGLPHAHILIILSERIRTPTEINDIVSAEIPENSKPKLYDLVKSFMIHGPCGDLHPRSPCMKHTAAPGGVILSTCSKHYPKEYCDSTQDVNGIYPKYRRREDGRTVDVRGKSLDNRWVVPYNPYLLAKYQAHTNVEICCSVASVKYLYKYIYKGHDNAMVQFTVEVDRNGENTDDPTVTGSGSMNTNEVHDVDEIKKYQECRYISATEAVWRIFRFRMHEESPSVVRLAVHLPLQQAILFRDDTDMRRMTADMELRSSSYETTLTMWFKKNREDPEARSITYVDFPERYTWDAGTKTWKFRKRKKRTIPVGRIHFVQPSEGERYYLRILLHHVPGATSYDDLKTVEGKILPTFKEAASSRLLVSDDSEWMSCLEEAAGFQFPAQLRQLFAIILVFCTPLSPEDLWNKYEEELILDIMHHLSSYLRGVYKCTDVVLTPHYEAIKTASINLALLELETCLLEEGKQLSDLPDTLQAKEKTHEKVLKILRQSLDPSFEIDAPHRNRDENTSNQHQPRLSLLRHFGDILPRDLIERERSYNMQELNTILERGLPLMNVEQRTIFERISASVFSNADNTGSIRNQDEVDDKFSRTFFIDGPGGTGKTFLYNLLLAYIRSRGCIALSVASTGLASMLLDGGKTAHSLFKIPLKLDETSTCNISLQSDTARLLREASIIIWDEAPMTNRFAFEAVSRTLQDIMKSMSPVLEKAPNGGKVVAYGGDFRQVLPVVRRGSRADVVSASLKRSPLWRSIQVLHLKANMRVCTAESEEILTAHARESENFTTTLLELGDGRYSFPGPQQYCDEYHHEDMVILPHNVCSFCPTMLAMIEHTFGDLKTSYRNLDLMSNTCILAPKNDDVDMVNNIITEMLPQHLDCKEYLSHDQLLDPTSNSSVGEGKHLYGEPTYHMRRTTDGQVIVTDTVQRPRPRPAAHAQSTRNQLYPVEFLNSVQLSGLPLHKLRLKVGQPIILMRNLFPSKGLMNGTRLICDKLNRRSIQGTIITGKHKGRKVFIPRISIIPTDSGLPFTMKRTQFPVRPAFCMTIHKAQGQTLEKVGLYLPASVFSHGQLYVALSRVKRQNSIYCFSPESIILLPGDRLICTRNVVYPEVLK